MNPQTSCFLEVLEKYVLKLSSGIYRHECGRKDLLKSLSAISTNSFDELNEDFERVENRLKSYRMNQSWTVYYNIYTDNIIIEKIIDINSLNRFIELRDKNIRLELEERIVQLSGKGYEDFVASLFSTLAWVKNIHITKRTRDGGIDFEGTFMDRNSGIEFPLIGQVKNWNSRVDFPEMTKFIGAMNISKKQNAIGIFVASNGFTDDAMKASQQSQYKILLYDAKQLIDLMLNSAIGVRKTKIEVVAPDEQFWSELIPTKN